MYLSMQYVYLITTVEDRIHGNSFVVWPSNLAKNCPLEFVHVQTSSRAEVITALLTSLTGSSLRCGLGLLAVNIQNLDNPSGAEIDFVGTDGIKATLLAPYRELLLREVSAIVQEYEDPDELGLIVRSLLSESDIEPEIEPDKKAFKFNAYRNSNSIPDKLELFTVYITYHPENNHSIFLYSRFDVKVEILEDEIGVEISGDKVSKNGNFGATIPVGINAEILKQITIGLHRSDLINIDIAPRSPTETLNYIEHKLEVQNRNVLRVIFSRK